MLEYKMDGSGSSFKLIFFFKKTKQKKKKTVEFLLLIIKTKQKGMGEEIISTNHTSVCEG